MVAMNDVMTEVSEVQAAHAFARSASSTGLFAQHTVAEIIDGKYEPGYTFGGFNSSL